MNHEIKKTLGLFPLTSHVLPGGRMQLRVYEPRYLRLVRDSLRSQAGFGLCMLNPHGSKDTNQHIYPVGTLVRIVDFESLDDGCLGITIEGNQLFDIESIRTDSDGLRVGEVRLRKPLNRVDESDQDRELRSRLQEVFEAYPELAQLYPQKQLDDPVWVYHRWLEILPVQAEIKQNLLQDNYTQSVRTFLQELFEQNQ